MADIETTVKPSLFNRFKQFIPSIISGVGGIANTGLQFLMNKYQNRENMKLAEYQYSKDLEMWNRNNQYNMPLNQMARLKDAGLNPNLVYGSGEVTGNTSGQIPKYSAPTMEYDFMPVDFNGMISQFQDFKLKSAQIDNVRAQTRGVQADALAKVYDTIAKRDSDWWSKNAENQIISSSMKATLDKINAEIAGTTQTAKTQSELARYSAESKYQDTREFEAILNKKALESMTPTQRVWFQTIMRIAGILK